MFGSEPLLRFSPSSKGPPPFSPPKAFPPFRLMRRWLGSKKPPSSYQARCGWCILPRDVNSWESGNEPDSRKGNRQLDGFFGKILL